MLPALLFVAAFSVGGSSVRTSASVDIQNPAGVSIIKTAPLELLITGGVPVAFTATVSATDSSPTVGGEAALLVSPAGVVLAASGNPEALSVSVDDGFSAGAGTPGLRRVRAVIAQFN